MSNINFGSGTLFFTTDAGASFKLTDIKDIEVCCEENKENVEYFDSSTQIVKLPSNHTMTVEFEMDRQSMFSLIYGQKMTNNWLKMHGGVMTRRGKK